MLFLTKNELLSKTLLSLSFILLYLANFLYNLFYFKELIRLSLSGDLLTS